MCHQGTSLVKLMLNYVGLRNNLNINSKVSLELLLECIKIQSSVLIILG